MIARTTIALALVLSIAKPYIGAQTPNSKEPALSAAETEAVNRAIATLHSESDRKVAAEFSNAKKVAEMLCRPAATAYWKKKTPGVDRVFLGTSDPHTLVLESDRRLTGTGQYRTPKGWTDFAFVCSLDPAKGTVTSFEATPDSEAH